MDAALSQGAPLGGSREDSGLICAILRFLNIRPDPLLDELSRASFDQGFLRPFIFCILSSDPSIRGLATRIATKLLDENKGLWESDIENRSLPREFGRDLWKQRQVEAKKSSA